MSIFDKSNNKKYAFFLTNFGEILDLWKGFLKKKKIAMLANQGSMIFFGLDVEQTMEFFNINLAKNKMLKEIGIGKAKAKHKFLKNFNLNLEYHLKSKRERDIIREVISLINSLLQENSDVFKFCEFSYNITKYILALPALDLSKEEKDELERYLAKLEELFGLFKITITQKSEEGNILYYLSYQKKVANQNDTPLANELDKEVIFNQYFSKNGDLVAKNKILANFATLLEEKRQEIKDFNPKLEYDIFSFLEHSKHRNSLTFQEDLDYERSMDKIFKKAILCLYLLEIQ
ncbi:hypothetical protein SSYRP_v1c02080 [Spiroplasma syrphidicola EA-1]|uniref:Uncharacterized protein n=1 Tax=Spiroplasma syrphidicola EA-1 TaxID=1276229 RepID=R4UD21_9MOLU|nr:hypothetical protein [Spiroplasma syrphidicola]AGM25804.1 hypothetical protein SSYRP_v1c02080 [Spiroplasma syrphidicola EA-1]